MTKKLPIYKLVVTDNEESGVNFNSFVEMPATEQEFLMFSKDEPIKFKADADRRIVTGVMMLADTPIYRNTDGEEFMVVFDAPTIETISQKFFKDGFSNNVNVDHSQEVEGVHLYESFIVDKERGIQAPKGFTKVPEGTWFASYKVENDEVWQGVLDGKFKGFSVEGMFNKQLVQMKKDININNKNMSEKKGNKLKELFKSFIDAQVSEEETIEVKMATALLSDGQTEITYEGDVLATGVIAMVVVDAEQAQPLPIDSYTLEDGTTFDVVDEEGRVDNVVLAESPEEEASATDEGMNQEPAGREAKKVIKSTVEESHFTEQDMKEIKELTEKFEALAKKVEGFETEKVEFAKAKEEAEKTEAEAKKGFETEFEKVKAQNAEMFELIKKIANEDAAPATEKNNTKVKFDIAAQRKAFKADLENR